MALPCGSRTPGLSVTLMRAFMSSPGDNAPSRPRSRGTALPRPLFGAAYFRLATRPTPPVSMGLGAHEDRATALGAGVLGQHPQPTRHFLVGLQHAAHVAAEAILVELVGGGRIPEPATIRADLVGQHNAHLLVLPQPPELHLEVHEADADAAK